MKKNLFIRRSLSVGGLTLSLTLSFGLSFAQQGEWTWMSGSNTVNGIENYGTQGVPSVLNHPSGLYEACEWTDTSGMLWLYGGSSISSTPANLWKYNPDTNEWTWVKGPGNSFIFPVYGTQGVPDAANTPGSRSYGVSTFTGKDGNLWLFGGNGIGHLNDLWKYDISTNEWTWVKGPNVSGDPGSYGTQGIPSSSNVPPCRAECAGSWVDSTGNFWLFAGALYADSYNDLWRYEPATNEWTWMKGGTGLNAVDVYGTKGVPDPANTPGGRNTYTKWNDGHNHLYLFGGDKFSAGQLHNDVWKYDINTNEWVWISGTNLSNNTGNATSQCSSDSNVYPSCRRESRACWTDYCQKFWIYGGSSQGSFYGSQSDLWKFDPVTLEWTWVSGPLTVLQTGNFGTQGVSSPSNEPPARSGNLAWIDKDGNLWMFGGVDQGWPSAWNDLWRYVPDTTCSGSCITNNQSQPGFVVTDQTICEKFCIDFTDISTNDPTAWLWNFPGGIPLSSTDQNPANICYDNPGSYDVTLITTTATGMDTLTLANYITVYSTPPFPVISQNGYALTSSAADAYQWQFNSVDIPGATSQSYTATQTGFYTVIISDANGCVNSATQYVLITGLENVPGDFDFSIYPNPSGGKFMIEWLNTNIADRASIVVKNTLGRQVYSTEVSCHPGQMEKEIHLEDAPAGIYFMEFSAYIAEETSRIFIVKKIIVSE